MEIENIEDPDVLVESIKNHISLVLSSTYSDLKNMLPEEEAIDDVRLDVIRKIITIKLIDEIKAIKHLVYSDVLDAYNELVVSKNTLEPIFKLENEESEYLKEELGSSMKRTIIISAALSALIPKVIPLVLIVGAPRLAADKLMKNYHTKRLNYNKDVEEKFIRAQNPLFELMDTLRTDYHKSNQEFKELEDRAIMGEKVIEDLMNLINPERVGLELIEKEEVEKVLKKEKVNR